MQRTNIYLEDRQTAALDRRAALEGVSRAEVVRGLIDRWLDGETTTRDVEAIDRTFGILAEGVPARAPGAREAWLEHLWQS
jgi:hypothetical protein